MAHRVGGEHDAQHGVDGGDPSCVAPRRVDDRGAAAGEHLIEPAGHRPALLTSRPRPGEWSCAAGCCGGVALARGFRLACPLLRRPADRSPHLAARLAPLLVALVIAVLRPQAVRAGTAPDPLFDETGPGAAAHLPDPWEDANRRTFRFNLGLDRWVIAPAAQGYAFAVPGPARRAVRRALANLGSTSVFVNDVLQLEGADASLTAVRFAINSSLGIAGLFDVASQLGLPGHVSDFGQTLALYGVPSGPYLFLPVVGPTTARDATGYLFDVVFRPIIYLLGPGTGLAFYTSIEQGTIGISARDAHGDELRALEASSMDYYASLRSAWAQNREAEIWRRRTDGGPIRRFERFLDPASLDPSRGEVVDAAAHRRDQGGEALALED